MCQSKHIASDLHACVTSECQVKNASCAFARYAQNQAFANVQEAERTAHVRPAPEYQAPDDALLYAAPPLHPERAVTEIHKLGRPPPSHNAHKPPLPLWQQPDVERPASQYAHCYSATAQHEVTNEVLAANAARNASLSPTVQQPQMRRQASSVARAPPDPELQLYRKQAWMQAWLQARGGTEPANVRVFDRQQLREATAAQRLLSLQTRRSASARTVSGMQARKP